MALGSLSFEVLIPADDLLEKYKLVRGEMLFEVTIGARFWVGMSAVMQGIVRSYVQCSVVRQLSAHRAAVLRTPRYKTNGDVGCIFRVLMCKYELERHLPEICAELWSTLNKDWPATRFPSVPLVGDHDTEQSVRSEERSPPDAISSSE